MKGFITGICLLFFSLSAWSQTGGVPFPWGNEVPYDWQDLSGDWLMEWENQGYEIKFEVEKITGNDFPFALYQIDLTQRDLQTERVVGQGRGLVYSFQTTLDIVLTINEQIYYTVTGAYIEPGLAMAQAARQLACTGRAVNRAVCEHARSLLSNRYLKDPIQRHPAENSEKIKRSKTTPEVYTSFFYYSKDGLERFEVPVRLYRANDEKERSAFLRELRKQ